VRNAASAFVDAQPHSPSAVCKLFWSFWVTDWQVTRHNSVNATITVASSFENDSYMRKNTAKLKHKPDL
jgi:hypothetical protein